MQDYVVAYMSITYMIESTSWHVFWSRYPSWRQYKLHPDQLYVAIGLMSLSSTSSIHWLKHNIICCRGDHTIPKASTAHPGSVGCQRRSKYQSWKCGGMSFESSSSWKISSKFTESLLWDFNQTLYMQQAIVALEVGVLFVWCIKWFWTLLHLESSVEFMFIDKLW